MSTRRPRDRELLRRTAQEFDPPPAVDPYYVKMPGRPGVAPGWYWQPAGASEPRYLGANVYMAETALQLELRDAPAQGPRAVA